MTQNHRFHTLISARWVPPQWMTSLPLLQHEIQLERQHSDHRNSPWFFDFLRFRLVITYHVFHIFLFVDHESHECDWWGGGFGLILFSVWFDNLSWVNKKLQTRWLRWIVKCLWFTVISWVMDFVCRWTTTPDHEDCNHSHFFRITLDQPWFYGSCHWWLTIAISGICFLHQLLTYL